MTEVSEVDRLLIEKNKLIDTALESFATQVERVAENIGRRIIAALNFDPDLWREPDGDDGRDVLRTALERRLLAFSDIDQARALILDLPIAEIKEFMDASGNDLRDEEIRRVIADLAGYAEETLYVQGVTDARGVLDTVSAEALIDGYINTTVNAIDDLVDGPMRAIIRDSLTANLGNISPYELADLMVDSIENRIPVSMTEAETRIAGADRFVTETVRASLEDSDDPENNPDFVMGYKGPDDSLTRRFCKAMVNHYFTVEQLNTANNAQGLNVRIHCGGYRCRHDYLVVPNSPDQFKRLNLKQGTSATIKAANEAAKSGRKKRKRAR